MYASAAAPAGTPLQLAGAPANAVPLISMVYPDLVTLLRRDDKDEFVVLINFSNRPQIGSVEVMNAKQFKPVKISRTPKINEDGFPLFRLNGFEWRIYHRAVTR